MSIIRLPEGPHVSFNQETKMLRCDRCPYEEALDEPDAEGHIIAFASAHRDCPEVSTEASREAAKKKVYNAAFLRGLGVRS